jgi:peptide/nickel transport system substrate-binding protein
VGEAFTTTQTALTKATVYYPADLWTSVTWHDGSPITMGDFVMAMILPFDRAKPESALYDEAQASNLEAYLAHFKGVVVESTDPLVITTYDDLWYLDAELIPTSWWPAYGYGPGAWHNIAVGTLAEADGKLAFSADKADANAVEWMNFVSGPSIEILYTELVTATGQSYIPFAPTMGAYVTADEAALRYENLGKWVREQGHFWLGTGPFYLNKVFTIENTLTLSRNENYPDAADRCLALARPSCPPWKWMAPGRSRLVMKPSSTFISPLAKSLTRTPSSAWSSTCSSTPRAPWLPLVKRKLLRMASSWLPCRLM